MKRVISLLIAVVIFLTPISANATGVNSEPTLLKAKATAYILKGTTASGEETREGICAAKKEWLGCTIIMYQRLPDDTVGMFIGAYEVKDTGGTKGIKSGKVIDVWRPSLDDAQAFMDAVYLDGCKGNVYIQVLQADG